jgi:tetratricopeptide (TPR) repeat protein
LLEARLAAPTLPGQHELLQQVGVAYLLEDHAQPAASALEKALLAQPPDDATKAWDYYYLAGAYALAENRDEALAAAEQAASLDTAPRFQGRPAWILYYTRDLDAARQRYVELLARLDDDQSAEVRDVMRDARLILSNVAVMQDRLPEAEEWLEQVLDEFPEDVGALNDLGYLWADQGKHLQRALRMVEQAVAAEPDNTAYRDSLGWVHYRLGNYAAAVAELEKAAAEEQPDGVILDHLGDAYLEHGQAAQARDAWQRAVEAFQRDEETELLEKTKAKLAEQGAGPTE